MVQAYTLLLVAFAAAPVFSAPLSVKVTNEPAAFQQRSVDDVENLDLRDPRFSFGRIFKSVAGVVKKVAPIGLKIASTAAGILIRDEDGNVYIRDVDLSDLTERELAALDTREPFRIGNVFRKVGGVVRKAASVANTVSNVAGSLGGLGLREEDDASDIDARDLFYLDLSELSERDIADLDLDLESREPINFGNFFRKVGGVANTATRVASTVGNVIGGLGYRDLEEGSEFDARDEYYAIEDLD